MMSMPTAVITERTMTAGDHAGNHLGIGKRRDQCLLDIMQEAREIDLRGGLQERGIDDVQHQDAGKHEFEYR